MEGHLDNSLTGSASQILTEKRAMAICKWLIENGIDCKRLIPVGFGSAKPIVSNDELKKRKTAELNSYLLHKKKKLLVECHSMEVV